MKENEIEFLNESNKIEREYSKEALEDAKKAWRFAKKNKDFIDSKVVLGIHKILMKRINPRIAGKIRTVDVYVGNRKCLDPSLIKEELRDHCEFQPSIPKRYSGLSNNNEEAVKSWHVKFEAIHPFEDGNGRTGRIIMNAQRLRMDLPLLIIHEGEEQYEYYKWFRENNNENTR